MDASIPARALSRYVVGRQPAAAPRLNPLCYQSPAVAGVRLTRRRGLIAAGGVVAAGALAVVPIPGGDSAGPSADSLRIDPDRRGAAPEAPVWAFG